MIIIVIITRYLFTWNGTSILSVQVDLLLGNFSLTSSNSSAALSQYFTVSCAHICLLLHIFVF